MERLERDIEAAFGRELTRWANAEGYNLAFLKIVDARGWPDRLITWGCPDGPPHMIWIEFKRPGEQPRPMQIHVHKILRSMGHDVRVYDELRISLDEVKTEVVATLRADSGL